MHQQHQSQARAFYTWLDYSLQCALQHSTQDQASPILTSVTDGEPSWQLSLPGTLLSASDAQTYPCVTSTDTHIPFHVEHDGSAQCSIFIPASSSSSSRIEVAEADCHVDAMQSLGSDSHISSESISAQRSRRRLDMHSGLQIAPAPDSAARLSSAATAPSAPHPVLTPSSNSVLHSRLRAEPRSALSAQPCSSTSTLPLQHLLSQLQEPVSQLREPVSQLQEPLRQLQEPLSQLQQPGTAPASLLCQQACDSHVTHAVTNASSAVPTNSTAGLGTAMAEHAIALASDTRSGTHTDGIEAAHAQLKVAVSEHSLASASDAISGACTQDVATSYATEQQLTVGHSADNSISRPCGTRNSRLKALARRTPTRPPTPVIQQASDWGSSHLSSTAASDRHADHQVSDIHQHKQASSIRPGSSDVSDRHSSHCSNTEGSDSSDYQCSTCADSIRTSDRLNIHPTGQQVLNAAQVGPDSCSTHCTGHLGSRVLLASANLSDMSGETMPGFGESRTVRRSLWADAAPDFP